MKERDILDNIDILEIGETIRSHGCELESEIILEHLMGTNRINKSALRRSGFSGDDISQMIYKLQVALLPWRSNG